jgi:hypothetical protein
VTAIGTMDMNKQRRSARRVSLGDGWGELARVRAAVEEYFADSTEELRSAVTMAALELAENVLKHGAGRGSGVVTMVEENGEVVLCTENGVHSAQTAQAVRKRIELIAGKGARQLYVTRMLELMQQPEPNAAGLGLLRIAYEGAFQLSCEILGDRLRIQARRRVYALPNR